MNEKYEDALKILEQIKEYKQKHQDLYILFDLLKDNFCINCCTDQTTTYNCQCDCDSWME